MVQSAQYRSSNGKRTRLGRRDVLCGGAASAFGLFAPRPLRAADRLKINIVNTAGNTNVVLATVLKQEGFFEDLNLDANILHVSDGSKLIGSLLSGESDMCALSGFGQVLPAIEKGAKLKILAGGAVLGCRASSPRTPPSRP
jgi:ABC-type nitrate/sulfonate/bicarbonate transport system substrate-binding protein